MLRWTASAVASLAAGGILWLQGSPGEAPPATAVETPPAQAVEQVLAAEDLDAALDVSRQVAPVRGTLDRGQTLGQLLREFGLEASAASRVTGAVAQYADVKRLRAGAPYVAYLNPEDRLDSFELEFPARGRVRVERAGESWRGAWHPVERRTELRTIQGQVEGAFESAVTRHGVPSSLAYTFAEVFRWDLDFNRDLRSGDRFSALYELVYIDGEPSQVGRVLAASYDGVNGRALEAYRFADGYYDPEGRPLRKMFLRSPLKFSRVTSGFNPRRFHPVLKKYRPHYGVDYGAPTGTPVYVTAHGTVESAAYSGGSGNMVKVRHPNGYLTAYLHLSRFAKGIRPGVRVRQGDLIGYVGATGLATGPHLDYRVQERGQWIDPLSLKAIPDEPIAAERLAEFRQWRDRVRESMDESTAIEAAEGATLAALQSQLAALDAAAVASGG